MRLSSRTVSSRVPRLRPGEKAKAIDCRPTHTVQFYSARAWTGGGSSRYRTLFSHPTAPHNRPSIAGVEEESGKVGIRDGLMDARIGGCLCDSKPFDFPLSGIWDTLDNSG